MDSRPEELRERFLISPVSAAVRAFLVLKGRASINDFYTMYKPFKWSTSYLAVDKMFWTLKQLGLIRVVGHAKGRGPIPKTLYEAVPERLEDPGWNDPRKALWGPRKKPGKKNA